MMTIAKTFRDMHISGDPFVLANAWDCGSAKLMVACGAKSIGTSSSAHAFTLGKGDLGHVTRQESIDHAEQLTSAVSVPVSADLENGYGHSPDEVALTIRNAMRAGIIAGSIEDIRAPETTPYSYKLAVERIEAAVQERDKSPGDFVLTARADGVMYGAYDLNEAIRRLQAFSKAGADVLFAPMPGGMEELAKICRAVDKPVSAICAGHFIREHKTAFANIGVARISLGASLARVTHNAIINQSRALFGNGDFSGLETQIGGDAITDFLLNTKDT